MSQVQQLRDPYGGQDDEYDRVNGGRFIPNRMVRGDPDDAIRGTNNDAAGTRHSAAQLGYFEDPFIQYFVPPRNPRRPPIINRGTHLRFKALDRLVRDFCQAFHGQCQVISIGAGSDTRFFLMQRDGIKVSGYFEIDFPVITNQKIAVLKRKRDLFQLASVDVAWSREECHSKQYHLIAADLRKWEMDCVEKLLQNGLDYSLPTLFLSECVLIYMEPSEADGIIQWAGKSFNTAAFLTYEQIHPNDIFGKIMLQNLQKRNIELKGIFAYPDLATQMTRYKERGWSHATATDMQTIYDKSITDIEAIRYYAPVRFMRIDHAVNRIGKIELLDELEEWKMLNQHYCIVTARNSGEDRQSPLR